jgi:hypothetical protein
MGDLVCGLSADSHLKESAMQKRVSIANTILRPRLPCRFIVFALLVLIGNEVLNAATIGEPKGEVVLTVSGAITTDDGKKSARFDRAMLESLPQQTYATVTPWTDGKIEFSGVSGRALMDLFGVAQGSVRAVALNDYAATIPVSDFIEGGAILALRVNGERMSVREKGPIWIIYPWSDHPELNTDDVFGRAVWQLKELVIQ